MRMGGHLNAISRYAGAAPSPGCWIVRCHRRTSLPCATLNCTQAGCVQAALRNPEVTSHSPLRRQINSWPQASAIRLYYVLDTDTRVL